jgi:hypothetical protein
VTKAQFAAHLLSVRLLANGKIAGSTEHHGSIEEGFQLACAHNKEEAWAKTEPFTAVTILAVGSREGKYGKNPGEAAKPEVVVCINKGSARQMKALPKEIDGVPVSLMKTTLIGISPDQATDITDPETYERGERIACGSSIATCKGSPGTLGALVQDKDGQISLLSCNHVLAAVNQLPFGLPILSPAPIDARAFGTLPRAIARLSRSIPLRPGHHGHVKACEEDVALGEVLDADTVSSWQGTAPGYDTPAEICDPEDGMKLKKFGRSTGLTRGAVSILINDPYPTPFHARGDKGTIWYKKYAIVVGSGGSFALPGDSGSLVVTEDESAAVGLLFSTNASGDLGLMFPIRHVLDSLGVTLISGHGT